MSNQSKMEKAAGVSIKLEAVMAVSEKDESPRQNLMDDYNNYARDQPVRTTRNQKPQYNVDKLSPAIRGAWKRLERAPPGASFKTVNGSSTRVKNHLPVNHLTERRWNFIKDFLQNVSKNPRVYFQERDHQAKVPSAEEAFKVLHRELLQKMQTTRWDRVVSSDDLTEWLQSGRLAMIMAITVQKCTANEGAPAKSVKTSSDPAVVSSSGDALPKKKKRVTWQVNDSEESSRDSNNSLVPTSSTPVMNKMEKAGQHGNHDAPRNATNKSGKTSKKPASAGRTSEEASSSGNTQPGTLHPEMVNFIRNVDHSVDTLKKRYNRFLEEGHTHETMDTCYRFLSAYFDSVEDNLKLEQAA